MSFRKNGKPSLRVLAHLGRVGGILQLHQQHAAPFQLSSVSAGAVTALHRLAVELNRSSRINAALAPAHVQIRDGLSAGESGEALPIIEQDLVGEVVRREELQIQALAYTTTNSKPELPQRGHNKQGRHDLRQLGLALIVDQSSQLPLAQFAGFLPPVRQRLRALTGQPEQLTLVFDAAASSRTGPNDGACDHRDQGTQLPLRPAQPGDGAAADEQDLWTAVSAGTAEV